MTAVVGARVAAPDQVGRLADARVVVSLTLVEARRVVAHPSYLALTGLLVLVAGIDVPGLTRESIVGLLETILLFVPLMSLFAANLVASSARRANAEETLVASPLGARARILALCLASLAPAALSATGVVAYWWLAYRAGPVLDGAVPMSAMASAPLLLVGATALGVATAQWLRVPGTALVVMAGLVVWTGISADHPLGSWFSPWALAYTEAVNPAPAGSHAWHAGYLLGLSVLAMVAALLGQRGGRRPVIVTGAVVAALTALAGWAQLP